MIQLDAGDIIKMKKKHPCGSYEWQILKTGADIKLRCCGCSHEIILKRGSRRVPASSQGHRPRCSIFP